MRLTWLLLVALAAGCLGPIGGYAVRPDEMARAANEPTEGCPDLSGTYQVRPSANWLSTAPRPEGSQRGPLAPSRPLTLFFLAIDRPETFERATLVGPASSRRLSFTFEGNSIEPRQVLLEEGVDYQCDHGAVLLERGPRVVSRDRANIQLYRGHAGALVEQTAIEEPGVWFLILPLWAFKWDVEWNRYSPVGAAP
jgi:hypothetical protein